MFVFSGLSFLQTLLESAWTSKDPLDDNTEQIGKLVKHYTVKFRYKDHSKLRPPWLLRPLMFQYQISFLNVNMFHLWRPVHYKDHFQMYHC